MQCRCMQHQLLLTSDACTDVGLHGWLVCDSTVLLTLQEVHHTKPCWRADCGKPTADFTSVDMSCWESHVAFVTQTPLFVPSATLV